MATYGKYTHLLAVTTNPGDRAAASPHSGGWSESHFGTPSDNFLTFLTNSAVKRANLLPAQASIIGWRYETFDLTGRRLTPLGAVSGRFQFPGISSQGLNLPQDALMISATASGNPNATRFNLRALPDGVTLNGEYQPTGVFTTDLNDFLQYLKARNYGFIGRNKTSPSSNVITIQAGVIQLNANIGGVTGDYIRLNRVFTANGTPVKGSYRIDSVAGANYTVIGLGATAVTQPSGSARLDTLSFFNYGTLTPNRAVSRKIGRPFEQYRGRASKRV